MSSYSRVFRRIRLHSGDTQSDVARAAKVQRSTVNRWEHEDSRPQNAAAIRGLVEWCPEDMRTEMLEWIGAPGLSHNEITAAVEAAYSTIAERVCTDMETDLWEDEAEVKSAIVLAQLRKLGGVQ